MEKRREMLAKGTALRVSYDDREKAKALGALWDGERKLWIAPPEADLAAFKKAGFLA